MKFVGPTDVKSVFPNKRNLEGVEKGKGPCRVAGSRGVGSAKDTP